MNLFFSVASGATIVLLLASCANFERHGMDPLRAREFDEATFPRPDVLTRAQEDRILALDPDRIGETEIRTALSNAPAPRVLSIHGGIYPVHRMMISFAGFLVGMGYPEFSVKHPGDGTYTFSCYEDAQKIAGAAAWYYEREGQRPMMIGHSQGGMQVIKVLRLFAKGSKTPVVVWNPLTWQPESRSVIRDPLTCEVRPVADLDFSFCSAVGAGGLTRLLPNQWDLMFKLRTVPDSVDEFTGFYTGPDILGGDNMGYGSANHFHPAGRAMVRNVELPSEYNHGKIPDTKHLAQDQRTRDWVNDYRPSDEPKPPAHPGADVRNILWAADVWYSVKRHWVIELQRLIRARRAQKNDH